MEFVFVVPRTALFPECYPHGLVAFSPAAAAGAGAGAAPALCAQAFDALIAREGFFVERPYAERTPALKQVIPYSIIVVDTGREQLVLCTRRLAAGGEARLHDKHSIGIGGHINPIDGTGSIVDAGTRREIDEELVVSGAYEVRRVGLLNDDSNPVGAVHVGVVQVVQTAETVEIREKELLEGKLVTVDELKRMLASGVVFETWSKLLVPHLDELLRTHKVAPAGDTRHVFARAADTER